MRNFSLFVLLLSSVALRSQTLTSGGPLKLEQANVDIRHYTLSLRVDPLNRSIQGYASIDLVVLKPASTLLFDLMDSLQVSGVWVNGRAERFTHEHDMISIRTAAALASGKTTVKIAYGGKPHVALRPPWEDGFTWARDSLGNPWVAVTAEGSGGKIYYPCKDSPSDEPNEGVDMIITVPAGLVVAGPGLLTDVRKKGSLVTYHWKTNYTINNYSILFNVGKYKVVSRTYRTIGGHDVPLQFYVLEEDASKADHHLDVFEQTIREQEKYFGEYPWAKEKIAICETPHLGMEHQTMNAYGNKFRYTVVGGADYDWLLHHEFGHEWWGNRVTAGDWADYWIHEGICSFGDALYIRDLEGEQAYLAYFRKLAKGIKNDKPVVMGKDIDEESAYHPDIYSKGAFFMHTLRFVMGDSLFFPALKNLASGPQYGYDRFVNTDEVEQFFSSAASTNLKPLFDFYLRGTQKLEIHIKQKDSTTWLAWLGNLDMALPVLLETSAGPMRVILETKPVEVKSSKVPLPDLDGYYLKKVVLEY